MRAAIAFALLFNFSAANASDSIPLSAVNKAAEVIDRAIEAHGGAATLAGIQTVSQRSTFTNFASNQSRRPGPPWDQSKTDNFYAVDFEKEMVFTSNKGRGSGFENDAATLIGPGRSVNIDYRASTVTPITEPDFLETVGPFIRVTPTLLVRELMNRRHTSHWLGETKVDGKLTDIVTLVMEVGPALALYIDQQSGLLTQAERVLVPFGQVLYRYLDYQEVDGIPVNKGFKLYANDEPNLIIESQPIEFNGPVNQYSQVPEKLSVNEPLSPDPLAATKLANGVHLIGGSGTYALFVETAGGVVAVGGTAGIPDRIDELRRAGVKQPIRFGVITHHHSDHILGVEPYRQAGAKVIGHKAHAEVIRSAAEGDIDLQTVDVRRRIGRGANRVEVIDIGPTPHSEHLLVAYLPAQRILFEADHSGAPRVGQLGPAQPVMTALVQAVDRLGLDVEHFVGAHSPRVLSAAEVRASVKLAAEPNSKASEAPADSS